MKYTIWKKIFNRYNLAFFFSLFNGGLAKELMGCPYSDRVGKLLWVILAGHLISGIVSIGIYVGITLLTKGMTGENNRMKIFFYGSITASFLLLFLSNQF